MALSRYDAWLLPREGRGSYDVTCKAQVVYCGCTGEPAELVERRPARRPWPWAPLLTVCAACGLSEDLDTDTCGESWPSSGYWIEGGGVELDEYTCPACGNDDADKQEFGDADDYEPDYDSMREAQLEDDDYARHYGGDY